MARNPQRTATDDDDQLGSAMMTLDRERGPMAGPQVVNERTVFGDIVTAQPIKLPRIMMNVLREIDILAGASGEEWYYRFPVKKKGGGIDYIEGPTIECADAVARLFGNCQVQTVEVAETTTHWLFATRFIDLQTGYTLIRPFRQAKLGSRLGGDDDERKAQGQHGTGVSKCQRNCVDHALPDLMRRAFKGAKANLVERIGKRLPEARGKIIDRIKVMGGDELLARVVSIYQRKPDEWLAPDCARMHAELKGIEDGMTSIDEVWPVAAPEPKRADVTDVEDTSGAAGSSTSEHAGAAAQASASPETAPPTSTTAADALRRAADLNKG